MVSREMLFTWSVLVTFLELASAALIVSNGAITEGESVIVRHSSKNLTGDFAKNCTQSDYEEKVAFNETTEKEQEGKPTLKSVNNQDLLPLPISIISDAEIKIPVSIVIDPIQKTIQPTSLRRKPDIQVEDENTKFILSSISTELLPPKETSIEIKNITNLLKRENNASIASNNTQNIYSSETSSQQIVPQKYITNNKYQNKTNEVNTPYTELQKKVKQYDAITTIDETAFDKTSLDINANNNIPIQTKDGSQTNDTSSNSELRHYESIKVSSVTTIQPTDKLYTNAPLSSDMIINAPANILSSDLEQPRDLIIKMKTIVDSQTKNNEERILTKITESNRIPHIHKNAPRPCIPLYQKYPLTSIITPFDNYGPLNLEILSNISSTEIPSTNITENNELANKSTITDINYNLNENSELSLEKITKSSKLLSNADTSTFSEIYFPKNYTNNTAGPLPLLTGLNSNQSDLIPIQDQQLKEYNTYEIQQSAITTTNAITVNRNEENYDLQSTESPDNVITSTVKEEILRSISTIPTLNDGDILHTVFDGTTTEVNMPEPIILSADYKNSDFFISSNLLNGHDELRETEYLSTTEVLLNTESTFMNSASDESTDNSNLIPDSTVKLETESNTILSVVIPTMGVLLDTDSIFMNITMDSSTDNSNLITDSTMELETESNALLSVIIPTTEKLLYSNSTSINNITIHASTDNSNLITDFTMELENSETIETSSLEINTLIEETSTTTMSSFSNREQQESTVLIETVPNAETDPTRDYEITTDSGLMEEIEVNTKQSLFNKCILTDQEFIINSSALNAATNLEENISKNIKHDQLDTTTKPNILIQNFIDNKYEYSTTLPTWNRNNINFFLRREPDTITHLPIISTIKPIDQSTKSDVTNWHPQSTFSDELIFSTEQEQITTYNVEHTTEKKIEGTSLIFKTQTYTNTQKPNQLNITNHDENLPTEINIQNAVRPEISITPARTHLVKTPYIPQQRETIRKIQSQNVIETQRQFTDSKILSIHRNNEAIKKYRDVMNKERGHIKYADTVTQSFYEDIISTPVARRNHNVRKLLDRQNTETNNRQLNLANKTQQKNYSLENIPIESLQKPKNNTNGITDIPVYKKRRGNIRYRGYMGVTNTTRNIIKTVNTNNQYEAETKVKSDILNNTSDLKRNPKTIETKQENGIPKVNFLESSFEIPERILATDNNNKMLLNENNKLKNKYKDVTSQVMLQNHEINSMVNSLSTEENATSKFESTDLGTLVQEEEFEIITTVPETQMMTTLSPLTVRVSKNAGFINNINLKDEININAENIKDEMLQIDIDNKENLKIAATTSADNLDRNLNISLYNINVNLLENKTNSDNTNKTETKTYKLEDTKTADIKNTFINDKNHYNTKFISKQGKYFSSVYNGEILGKQSDVQRTNNFSLEEQKDRIELFNEKHISNSSIISNLASAITIGAESSTNNVINSQGELIKANSSVEDIATTQNLEDATTVESVPVVSTTSVPIKRKRKRRPIRKSIRKFHAVFADGHDNLEIRNDDNPTNRIIRSTTTGNENHKPHTRMRDPVVPIINSENRVYAHTGHFVYSYESGDGTQAFETGDLKNTDESHTGEAVHGGFSYKDKEGQQFSVEYTADENGYRPRGAHLPTPPPIPPAIARALEYLATKTTPEEPTTQSASNT